MSRRNPDVSEVVQRGLDAVTDVAAVDWNALASEAEDESRQALHALQDIARIHRAHAAFVTPPPAVPFTWGALEVQGWMASGVHGDVCRAWDPRLDRLVALKLLRPEDDGTHDTAGAIDEGRRLARVRRPNVVTVHGADRVILMDLGAGDDTHGSGGAHGLQGTPLYTAPELLQGGAPTVASDVYAVGVLLHYLLTGRYPVVAATLDALRRQHAAWTGTPRLTMPMAPRRLNAVLLRALAPRPGDRFQSAAAMGEALQTYLSSEVDRFRVTCTAASAPSGCRAWSVTPAATRTTGTDPNVKSQNRLLLIDSGGAILNDQGGTFLLSFHFAVVRL